MNNKNKRKNGWHILNKKAGFLVIICLFLLPCFVGAYCNETQTVDGNVTSIVRQCTPETSIGGAPLLGIILAPLILSFLLLFGAVHLDSTVHGVLKMFLFLFGIVPYWASMHFGTIVLAKYYNLLELQNAMADSAYWVGMIFFTLVSYFIIYTLIKMFARIAENKEQEFKY